MDLRVVGDCWSIAGHSWSFLVVDEHSGVTGDGLKVQFGKTIYSVL